MTDFLDVDATLEDWNALRATTDFSGLLLGNGASRAVWDDFGYDSLFENARTVEEKPLSPSELSVFDAMQTRSFEQVLGALKTTSRVNKALAVSSAAPRNRYYADQGSADQHRARGTHPVAADRSLDFGDPEQ